MTASQIDRARRQTLGDVLHRTAVRYPAKLAIVDGETEFTFAEFDAVVDRFAQALAAAGLTKGDRLALMSRNCWHFAVLVFATARLGVILVPVNFMLTEAEVSYVLDSSGATGFLVEDGLLSAVSGAVDSRIAVRGVIRLAGHVTPSGWIDVADWAQGGPAYESLDPPIDDDDPIRLMYTSGTESRPKGVVLSSRSLIAEYTSCLVDGKMTHDDVDLHALPLYHCAALDAFLGPDVYVGATGIILRSPDPTAILQAISKHRVTKFFAPPTVWISILRSPLFDETDLSSLRKGYYGASPMPTEILREIQERLPGIELWNFYGQTELGPLATLLPPEDQAEHAGSAGRSVLNIETRVVDSDGLPVPPGTVGEVVHRGPHIALGYWGDPDSTAAAFRSGWFHSGDLAVMSPDGRLTIVDRIKDMIKSGGENVASREV
ncbi:AMP-binding protein, partial [Streptomyces sp. NPDC007162]|uniref:AMP-binding protein n=1 Tax=Streptomyces sp. NPDC007162 TaxID=3156917 RepID=UPI0033D88EBA